MKIIQNVLKSKMYLKLLGLISIPIIIFVVVAIVILDIIGAVVIDSEYSNDKDYMTALKQRQSEIEKETKVKLDLVIYYSLDNVTRDKSFDKDNTIHINQDDAVCFIDGDKQIEKNDKQKAYGCLDYNDKQINRFEYYYKLFNQTSNYVGNNADSTGTFGYPVDEPYVITAGFNSNDSVHNGKHEGVDFVPLSNQKVKSSSNGTVIETETSCDPYGGYLGNTCGGGFGNHIVVQTKQGDTNYHVIYGHMSKLDVSKGDKVTRGQYIGVMGNSGNTTGKHVHLQIERQDDSGDYIPIDPIKVLSDTEISADKIEIMERAGVDQKDYEDVDYIISHESSWNYKAVNSSSGAYGLCQALPANKMASSGEDWKTNPVTQMKWCDGYAIDRYGSWQKASDFWRKNEWW